MRAGRIAVRSLAVSLLLCAGVARAQLLSKPAAFTWSGPINSNVTLLSPGEQLLFVSNQGGQRPVPENPDLAPGTTVSVLAIASDGALSLRGVYPTGHVPCGMAIDPSGQRLYVATADGIFVHAVAADGSLSTLQTVPPIATGRYALYTGIQYVSLPGGDFVYQNENLSPPSSLENLVSAYRVLPGGTLALAGSYGTGDVGSSSGLYAPPRLLAAAGGFLFAGNAASVSVFAIGGDGSLAQLGAPWAPSSPPTPLPPPYTGQGAPALATDPTGAWLYATYDGVNVVRAAVLPDGTLAEDALFTSDASYPITGITMHPSGNWFVTGAGGSGMRVYDTASPGPPIQKIGGASGVEFNAAGDRLYAGNGSFVTARVTSWQFGPGGGPQVSCVGSPTARAVVFTAPDLCGAIVSVADGTAGTCPGAASCTYAGQASITLAPGSAEVVVTATSASGVPASCTSYLEVKDGTAPLLACPAPATVECTGEQTPIDLAASCTDACGCDTSCAPGTLPAGSTAVTCTATDAAGNVATCEVPVVIADTTPPQVSLEAAPAVLWPPDHRLVPIDLAAAASDGCDPAPALGCEVASSEADDGLGDGDTPGDVVRDADGRLWLRAERSGAGGGRVYTVTCFATDAAGNTGSAAAQVVVPHSMRGMR
jgi:hypothetical protein